MKYARGFVLMAALSFHGEVWAQIRPLPPAPRSPGINVVYGNQRRIVAWSGIRNTSFIASNGIVAAPIFPFPVYAFPTTSISLFYPPLPFVVSSPVVINQPIVVLAENRAGVANDDIAGRAIPRQRDPIIQPARPAPERRGPPPAALRPRTPEIVPTPKEPNPVGQRTPSRSDRLLSLGKWAFADGLHGRAERFFAKATEVPPVDPLAYFYLGQSQFARAEYQEAVASIEAGLRIMPNWPRSVFRAQELYGPDVEEFQDHLKRLEETLARHPNDRHLLFLYGYELWFANRKEEARTLLERAGKAMADPALINLFLNSPVAVPVARGGPR